MSSGGSGVMIPASVKQMILNIKDITKKHSDEDIHSMLIDCSMDPNETIQKLLYLDTFHVVKRKTDRKEVSNNRSYEDSRQGGGQGRGGRGWRGSNSSQDGVRGRNFVPQKETRVNRSSERDSAPASAQTINKETANEQKSLPVALKDLSNVANGTSTQCGDLQSSAGVNALVADGSSVKKLQNGSRGRNSAPKEIRVNRSSERGSVSASDQTKNKETANEQKSLPAAVKDLFNAANETSSQCSDSQSSAGVNAIVADGSSVKKLPNTPPDGIQHPSVKSKPTFASCFKAGSRPPVSNSNHKAVASVGSVPSLNSSKPDAVSSNGHKVSRRFNIVHCGADAICIEVARRKPQGEPQTSFLKQWVSTQQVIAEPSPNVAAESNTSQTNHVHETEEKSNPISTAPGIATTLYTVMPNQHKGVVEDQLPTSNSAIQLSEQNDSSEVFVSASGSATVEAVSQESPELCTEHDSAEPQLSDVQNVIFPNHFRVPEEYKIGLIFGSFDVSPGFTSTRADDSICENAPSEPVETFHAIDETVEEPSSSIQSVSSTAPEVDYVDLSQSPENIQENPVIPSEDGDPITAAPEFDEPKQETHLATGGPPFPLAQNMQNYYGFLPPMIGTQPMQFEKSDSQGQFPSFTNGNSLPQSTTPPPSQHTGLSQSSIPLSQQQGPMFRQAYPYNYLPYAHYLSPYFMPPMLVGHGGFQQQPPSGYLPQPAVSATATKFPLPPYKPLASSGSQGHIGIPGPFTSSPAAFGLSNAVGSGGNNDNEDIATSHLKENNMYPSGQQIEGSPVWIPAPGHYNLPPHGQHVAFSPTQSGQGAFAGLYHQSIPALSTYYPHQQTQNLLGSAEAVGHPPPPASYQQHQGAQMNWNSNSY